jgi:hypothetical protein
MRTVLRLLSLIAALPASLAFAQEMSPPPAPAPQGAAQPAPAPIVPAQPAPAAPYGAPPAQAYPYAQPAYPYYPPPADTAERRAVLGELANVDAQIASVQAARNRHGLGGPITMMATGFGSSIVFSIVSLVQWSIAEDIQQQTFFSSEYDYDDYDLNDDGVINGEDEDRARRGARTVGVLSILGLGVGVGGSVFLAKRLAARRKFDPELEGLRARRIQLLRHLQYGGMLGRGGMQLSLSGKF